MGDLVFVPLQLYKRTSLKDSKSHKLAPNFYGPYQLCKLVGQVAYALDIPNKEKIHDVFHVSCLDNILGTTTHLQIEFLMLYDDKKLLLEPEFILEIKTTTLQSNSANEYLIN